jgi:flagellar motility protein MotE (MotC chaperone)
MSIAVIKRTRAAITGAAVTGAFFALSGFILLNSTSILLAQPLPAQPLVEAEPPSAQAHLSAEVGLYCENIRDAAHEARVGWQAQSLLEIEARIEARMRELADLRADYEEWLARRQEFLRKAEDGVIDIYARMRPEAAAAQLASMDNETASAVIAKLNPRQSSAILNEMEPGRAAQLTKTVAGTALTQENAL